MTYISTHYSSSIPLMSFSKNKKRRDCLTSLLFNDSPTPQIPVTWVILIFQDLLDSLFNYIFSSFVSTPAMYYYMIF